MRFSRHNRLVTLLALLAVVFSTTAYVAHGFGEEFPLSPHNTVAQCDLCLQFSGTAGAPHVAGLTGKPPVGTYVPLQSEPLRFASREHPTHRLPRAPPISDLS